MRSSIDAIGEAKTIFLDLFNRKRIMNFGVPIPPRMHKGNSFVSSAQMTITQICTTAEQ
jgi:hypothetical protein